MFLQPKKSKFPKQQKKKLKKFTFKSNKIKFGTVALKALESGYISAKHIEAARQAISRKTKRKGKIWICTFPNVPITKKPIETRMGKGKGSVSFWAAKIRGGSIIFELCGVNLKTAITAFKTGGAKLPVRTVIFKK